MTNDPNKKPDRREDEELHTENPLSEKDEVKQAEERLNKNTDPSVAADLKNREHDGKQDK